MSETTATCSFEGCGKGRYGRKELCQSHDQQLRRGKPLTPLRPVEKAKHCVFQGCRSTVLAKGMCTAHYHQKRRGEDLSVTPTWITQGRDDRGRKVCRGCGVWKPESDFSPNNRTGDGLARICKSCRIGVSTRSRHNLKPGQYADMLARQGGRCALCQKEPDSHRLFVDHDHACCPGAGSCGQCVRSLLCRTCNSGLGMFRDDPELLRKAINYVEHHCNREDKS